MQNVNPRQFEIKSPAQTGELLDIGQLPFGLDPQKSPIIAQHWFGWRPIGAVAAQVVMRLQPPREMPNRPPLTHEKPKFID